MKSKKNDSSKEMKTKIFQNSKISELNQCQCHIMYVRDNVMI